MVRPSSHMMTQANKARRRRQLGGVGMGTCLIAATSTTWPRRYGKGRADLYGTPVITHDDPGQQGPEAEAIRVGRNGDLFKRGDVDDLARLIWKWSSRPWPDEEVRRCCYEVVEQHYNPESQVKAIEGALAGAAGR